MLTRIRNAAAASLPKADMPASKMKAAIADVLKEEGYISNYAVVGEGVKKLLVVELKYDDNGKPVIGKIERVSKPSCRRHCPCSGIPRIHNGLGTVILSTPNGIMSGRKATKENVGGEILCYVW